MASAKLLICCHYRRPLQPQRCKEQTVSGAKNSSPDHRESSSGQFAEGARLSASGGIFFSLWDIAGRYFVLCCAIGDWQLAAAPAEPADPDRASNVHSNGLPVASRRASGDWTGGSGCIASPTLQPGTPSSKPLKGCCSPAAFVATSPRGTP